MENVRAILYQNIEHKSVFPQVAFLKASIPWSTASFFVSGSNYSASQVSVFDGVFDTLQIPTLIAFSEMHCNGLQKNLSNMFQKWPVPLARGSALYYGNTHSLHSAVKSI